MKKLVITLSALSMSLTAVAAPSQSNTAVSIQNLSMCEQQIFAGMDQERQNLLMAGMGSVGAGVVAGMMGAGVYSASESSGVVFDGLTGFGVTDPETGGMLVSAVGTGAVVAAIAFGGSYVQYRLNVDRNESVLQLFKEVRNNGMGPQMDIRVAAIQKLLRKTKAKAERKMKSTTGQEFNDQGSADDQVRPVVMQVVTEFANAKLVSCKDPAETSKQIDKLALQSLIQKFNPTLTVMIK